MSLAAIRNGLFTTLTTCGPWDDTEVSTCDFGILESTSACAIVFMPGNSTIEPNHVNNAPARGYLRHWGIGGIGYLKDTGDPELVLARVWQFYDDLYNTVRKDDTLNGAAFSSMLTDITFDLTTGGVEVGGQFFMAVPWRIEAEEIN